MSRSLAARVAIVILAVLVAGVTSVSSPILAQDNENPSWLVAGASYEGVWKTVGANAAPDAESQITFGYLGADGSLVLFPEEAKLAIRYGFNPIGASNHSETNVLTTRTEDGFRWGQFDPGRNSAEFTCVVGNNGETLSCARHAMFNGREFFNNIEMTRVATEGTGLPSAPPTSARPDRQPSGAVAPPALLAFEPLGSPTSYNQTANHRSIWDLQYWHDRIYIGHGDWDANTGPVRAIYFDVNTGAFVHDQGFTFDDEAIETYKVFNDVLFAIGSDAKESWDFGNIYVKLWDSN